MELDQITESIIGAAIKVHSRLGPGLLESVYETCLASELRRLGLAYERQKPLQVVYNGEFIEAAYRIDLFVEHAVVVEVKAISHVEPVHKAQLLTYLKLTDATVGLLINFNVTLLRDGLTRMVLHFKEEPRRPRRPRR